MVTVLISTRALWVCFHSACRFDSNSGIKSSASHRVVWNVFLSLRRIARTLIVIPMEDSECTQKIFEGKSEAAGQRF